MVIRIARSRRVEESRHFSIPSASEQYVYDSIRFLFPNDNDPYPASFSASLLIAAPASKTNIALLR
jgi:hypothetical protein